MSLGGGPSPEDARDVTLKGNARLKEANAKLETQAPQTTASSDDGNSQGHIAGPWRVETSTHGWVPPATSSDMHMDVENSTKRARESIEPDTSRMPKRFRRDLIRPLSSCEATDPIGSQMHPIPIDEGSEEIVNASVIPFLKKTRVSNITPTCVIDISSDDEAETRANPSTSQVISLLTDEEELDAPQPKLRRSTRVAASRPPLPAASLSIIPSNPTASEAHAEASLGLTPTDDRPAFRTLSRPGFHWGNAGQDLKVNFPQYIKTQAGGQRQIKFPTNSKGKFRLLLFFHHNLFFHPRCGYNAFTVQENHPKEFLQKSVDGVCAIFTFDVPTERWYYIGVFKRCVDANASFGKHQVYGFRAVHDYPFLGEKLEEYFAWTEAEHRNKPSNVREQGGLPPAH